MCRRLETAQPCGFSPSDSVPENPVKSECPIKLERQKMVLILAKKEYKQELKNLANECDVLINVCTQNAFTDVALKKLIICIAQ